MKMKFAVMALMATSVFALGAAHADSSFYFRLRPSVQIQNQESFSVRINGDRAGVVGSSFAAKAEASSPRETLQFSVSDGGLPPGVSLNSTTGDISGQPMTHGRFTATITAKDAFSTASAPLSVTVYDALSIESTIPPYATVGQSYSASFDAIGGDASYTWTLSGTPPTGLSLANTSSSTAMLSGTPSAAGTWDNLRVNLSDGAGHETSSLPFSIAVANPLTLAGSPASIATVGDSYTATFTTSGGHAPTSWSLSGNTLPEGLSFANGTISGSPTKAGTTSGLVVRISDASGAVKSSDPFSIAVSSPLTLSGSPSDIGTVGVSYHATFTSGGGFGSYTWDIVGGSLPDGLTLSGGTISGTPTKAGVWSGIVLRVTDGNGRTKQANPFSVTISNPLTLGGVLANSANVGQAYSSPLTVSGGRPPYIWSAVGLPNGLAMDGGTVSGTPTAGGTSGNIILGVTDMDGRTAQSGPMTINVVVPVVRQPASGEYYTYPILQCNGSCPSGAYYNWTQPPAGGNVSIYWNGQHISGTSYNGILSSGGATYYRGSFGMDVGAAFGFPGFSYAYAIYRTIP